MATLAPRTTAFAVRGPITRAELPGLCARVCRLFEREQPEIAYCDVESVAVDAVTVEALALLQLGAQRNGCRVLLRNASADLVELVALMGLGDVLPEER